MKRTNQPRLLREKRLSVKRCKYIADMIEANEILKDMG